MMNIEFYKALPYHKFNSAYGIEIIKKQNSYNIVTITELSDITSYDGYSITNGMEMIIEDILNKFKDITIENTIFIECYPKNENSYSFVEYKDKNVSWKYISTKDYFGLRFTAIKH